MHFINFSADFIIHTLYFNQSPLLQPHYKRTFSKLKVYSTTVLIYVCIHALNASLRTLCLDLESKDFLLCFLVIVF